MTKLYFLFTNNMTDELNFVEATSVEDAINILQHNYDLYVGIDYFIDTEPHSLEYAEKLGYNIL